jgi:hypothetical protein
MPPAVSSAPPNQCQPSCECKSYHARIGWAADQFDAQMRCGVASHAVLTTSWPKSAEHQRVSLPIDQRYRALLKRRWGECRSAAHALTASSGRIKAVVELRTFHILA